MKSRLRNKLYGETLDEAMRVSVEGPETLMDEDLDAIINNKNLKEYFLVLGEGKLPLHPSHR